MIPEPNFPAKPEDVVGRQEQVQTFRQALQQGLITGRTASFAILGDWGVGKSSLILKFADVCTEPSFNCRSLCQYPTTSTTIFGSRKVCSTNLRKLS